MKRRKPWTPVQLSASLHAMKAPVLLSKCAPIIIDAFPITSSSTLSPVAHELDRSLEDAGHILEQCEGAFDVLDPKYAALGDNVALALLDLVWVALLRHLLRPLLPTTVSVDGASVDSETRGGSSPSFIEWKQPRPGYVILG